MDVLKNGKHVPGNDMMIGSEDSRILMYPTNNRQEDTEQVITDVYIAIQSSQGIELVFDKSEDLFRGIIGLLLTDLTMKFGDYETNPLEPIHKRRN